MDKFLYSTMDLIAKIHNEILHWNDTFEYNFSDKELHFLVIGLLGIIMILAVHPIFVWLAKKNHVMVISWIYVFTLIIVITFAIEIGQRISHTGTMDFDDIMFGVVGFFAFFAVFAVLRAIIHALYKARKRKKADENTDGETKE